MLSEEAIPADVFPGAITGVTVLRLGTMISGFCILTAKSAMRKQNIVSQ
jgi:hypothetical protein